MPPAEHVPHRYRYIKPTPAWVVIGLLTSSLILILQITLQVARIEWASFIVALTYNIAILMVSAFFLVAQRLPFLDIEIDLRSVVSRRSRQTREVMVEIERPPPPYEGGMRRSMESMMAGGDVRASEDAVRTGAGGEGLGVYGSQSSGAGFAPQEGGGVGARIGAPERAFVGV